ncbi:velvet factor-domain-containing protein [Sordaria sp. MPI-SDFR-AT-0083]|nr:velvet factor-domain-containing protein [Sordaria sp. MPI-SDFR-AT-0083]
MQPYSSNLPHQLPPDHTSYHHDPHHHHNPHASPYPPRHHQLQQQQQLPSMAPPNAPPPPSHTNSYQDPTMGAPTTMSGSGSSAPPPPLGPGSGGPNSHGDGSSHGGQLQSTPPSQQQQQQQQQERVPLTVEERMQQEQNLKPYSGTDSQGRMYSEIEYSMFICNVSLYTEDALKEVNLVRHTTSTPSISSTTPASYASLEQTTPAYSHILPSNRDVGGYGHHQGMSPYGGNQGMNPYDMQTSPYQAHHFHLTRPDHTVPREDLTTILELSTAASGGGQQPQGMFTRNLIGSLVCSAFRLTDTNDKIGIWFVMQDLSVRTEGVFRLQFSFVNVGLPTPLPSSGSSGSSTGINQSKAPILASVFSEPFQVYSAKKFPGVCDSTALSKCFATQGIKIPIRKEGANSKNNEDDDDY